MKRKKPIAVWELDAVTYRQCGLWGVVIVDDAELVLLPEECARALTSIRDISDYELVLRRKKGR